jgi:hypothetical protein
VEDGKKRLAGDTARAATSGEVKDLRRFAAPTTSFEISHLASCHVSLRI